LVSFGRAALGKAAFAIIVTRVPSRIHSQVHLWLTTASLIQKPICCQFPIHSSISPSIVDAQ
jgi:hypothetical protein